MSRRSHNALTIAATLAACAMLGGPIAAAQASDATIVAAITNAAPKITTSQAKVLDGLATYEKTHSATKLIRAVKAQDSVLRSLRNRLSHTTASTSNGAKGKSDIIRGLKLIIDSNTTLSAELGKSSSGQPVSTAKLSDATKSDHKGNADLTAGIKYLQRT